MAARAQEVEMVLGGAAGNLPTIEESGPRGGSRQERGLSQQKRGICSTGLKALGLDGEVWERCIRIPQRNKITRICVLKGGAKG